MFFYLVNDTQRPYKTSCWLGIAAGARTSSVKSGRLIFGRRCRNQPTPRGVDTMARLTLLAVSCLLALSSRSVAAGPADPAAAKAQFEKAIAEPSGKLVASLNYYIERAAEDPLEAKKIFDARKAFTSERVLPNLPLGTKYDEGIYLSVVDFKAA